MAVPAGLSVLGVVLIAKLELEALGSKFFGVRSYQPPSRDEGIAGVARFPSTETSRKFPWLAAGRILLDQ